MRIDQLKSTLLVLGVSATLLLTGCAELQTGGGKNPVSGSAAGASSTGAANGLEHCARPLGTLAVEENTRDPWYAVLTGQYHLPSTVPLIRLMVQQSNCFVVVERGEAMHSLMGERDLAASGELRTTSNMGKGQMVAADYVVTPSIQFSEDTGGAGAALGALGGYGAVLGIIASSMKSSEASTTMMLTDTRSGVQIAAAQGSAKNVDFGLGGLFGHASAGGSLGAYSETPEGKVIAAAFLDSYNEMVKAVRQYAPQRVAGGLGAGGNLKVDGATTPGPVPTTYSLADAQRKLAQLGLYSSKVDGLPGPGTSRALGTFQKANGLPVTGKLDPATVSALAAR